MKNEIKQNLDEILEALKLQKDIAETLNDMIDFMSKPFDFKDDKNYGLQN